MSRKKFESSQQFLSKKIGSTSLIDTLDSFYYSNRPEGVETTIPVITANTRIVHQVTFPEKGFLDRAFIGFKQEDSLSVANTVAVFANLFQSGSVNSGGLESKDLFIGNSILVYKNSPNKAIRLHSQAIGATDESFISPVGTTSSFSTIVNSLGTGTSTLANVAGTFYISYNQLNSCLLGYYTAGGTGWFGINKKVVVESMWFTESGNDLVLNIAFNNYSSTDSTTTPKVQVYIYTV